MKRKSAIIIILAILLGIGILLFVMYLVDMERMKHNYSVVFSNWGYDYAPPELNSEENNINEDTSNIVIIKDGKITNEELIEEFIGIQYVEKEVDRSLIIREYSNDNEYIEKEIQFIPYKEDSTIKEGETTTVEIGTIDDLRIKRGKFVFIKRNLNSDDSDVSTEYNAFDYKIERVTRDGIVTIQFNVYSSLICLAENPVICTYNLDSSNYIQKFDLIYSQRKDLGVDKIIDKDESEEYDFNVYTYGGDVSITLETDMVYDLKKALEEKVITVDDILAQARIDADYGICFEGAYSDGGSVEFCYKDYTILKFSTLDGNEDLVIGMEGQIINSVDDLIE